MGLAVHTRVRPSKHEQPYNALVVLMWVSLECDIDMLGTLSYLVRFQVASTGPSRGNTTQSRALLCGLHRGDVAVLAQG